MDTNGVPALDESVRLVYRATTADLTEAVLARNSRTPTGRRRKWVCAALAAPFLALSVLFALWSDGVQPVSIGLAAGALSVPVTVMVFPRLQARAFAGLLEKTGEIRAAVDDSGVQVTTADTATRIGWTAQPLYTETDGLFVMLSADKQSVGMTVLPKRGVQDPADIDRLRSVLDRNLTRL